MKEQNKNEFKGQTVDEAIAAGLLALNLTKDKVDVEIKSYGGIFTKSCVILTPKQAPITQSIPEVTAIADNTAEIVAEHTPNITLTQTVAEESAEAPQKTELSPEDLLEVQRTAGISFNFVKELVAKMNLVSEVTVQTDGNDINISIEGADAGQIIGYRGETLDAIQYLSLLLANQKDKSFIRVSVDAGNYRKRRAETLTRLANSLAHKAAQTGRKIELEPMNPFERRVIHTALANDKFVKTESEGEGKFRHVNIIPNETNRGSRDNGGRSDRSNYRGNRENRSFDNGSSSDNGSYSKPSSLYQNRIGTDDNRYDRAPSAPYQNRETRIGTDNNRYDRTPAAPYQNRSNRSGTDDNRYDRTPTAKPRSRDNSESTAAPSAPKRDMYDTADAAFVPKPEDSVAENSFGTSVDFRKKGASKTRSFGYNSKKF